MPFALPAARDARALNLRSVYAWTLSLLVVLVLWDAFGGDLALARLFGTSSGFAMRSNHAFVMALHEIPRQLSSVVVLALLIGVFKPWGFLKRMVKRERVQLVLSVLGGMLLITLLKRFNATSCPWDLREFGGAAMYVSHWAWGANDLGPGHCFPAGHASSAFGFLAGWFVVRRTVPEIATRWLIAALAVGLVLGVAQQMRGAHYMSHTLWTGWICWVFGLAVDTAYRALRNRPVAAPAAEVEVREGVLQ